MNWSGEPFNSVSVNIEFRSRDRAERFYFDAPGEGICVGRSVMKCVEGDEDLAKELMSKARAARATESLDIHPYNVEAE